MKIVLKPNKPASQQFFLNSVKLFALAAALAPLVSIALANKQWFEFAIYGVFMLVLFFYAYQWRKTEYEEMLVLAERAFLLERELKIFCGIELEQIENEDEC